LTKCHHLAEIYSIFQTIKCWDILSKATLCSFKSMASTRRI